MYEVYGPDYNPIHKEVPKFAIWMASFFDKTAAVALPRWGKRSTYINKDRREILGIEFIEPKKSLQDMAESLIKTGYIPDKRRK